MALVTVRVVPRSGRREVTQGQDGSLTIRVRAAPVGGQATEEAARLLAAFLGVPPSTVRPRRGTRSRTKVFEVPDPV